MFLAIDCRAEPSSIGQTGLIHMPDARLEDDGVWRFGVSQDDPYFNVWSSVSFFPRLELSGRYVTIDDVPGFTGAPELGDYRDKAFDAKWLLVRESTWVPAIALGAQDFVGTRLFRSEYVAISKAWSAWDATIGYGRRRIDGVFGGLRYRPPWLRGWRLLAEYDANDYARDHGAVLSGAAGRDGGWTYGIGYRNAWWGAQVAYQDGDASANAYVAVPLMEREWVPKLDEPPPEQIADERAALAEWAADRRYAFELIRGLERQGYADVHLRLQGDALEIALTHERISLLGRSIGRAARTALRLGPQDLATLRITYTASEQPLVTYEFRDIETLERYFRGAASRAELEGAVSITYASGDVVRQLRYVETFPFAQEPPAHRTSPDAFLASARRAASQIGLFPFNVRIFFNDPGQPVRYDTFAVATYQRRLERGLFLNGAARLTLFENVSDVRRPSTSLLPHVRSDIGEYRREGDRLRLQSLLLNKYALLAQGWYGRVSAGYYEEMYAGTGAQVLYLPRGADWAADLAVDAVRQRAPGEAFGFRDYSVVTALTSLHYRFPQSGVTATARLGRFLAKDEGVRFELKRRFRSGVELGAWYTWTNEKDVTNPGTPDSPYRDKGLFVAIPLSPLLTKDTKEYASMAIADYTRDVGQMVASPGDLYRLMEHNLRFHDAEHAWLRELTQ